MADDFTVTLKGLEAAEKALFAIAAGSEKAMSRANFRIATRIRDICRRQYAPRSPTVGDIRKATGRAMTIRKARGTSRPKPGGLERSIEFEADATSATVFVAANSEAGAYAFKIHELKGVEWYNRGIGTISKGPKADDQFIVRAIRDNAKDAFAILEDEQKKALQRAAA